METYSEVVSKAKAAHEASRQLGLASSAVKNQILANIADLLVKNIPPILTANLKDLKHAQQNGMSDAMLDRLALTEERIRAMAEGVLQVIDLPDPVGVIKKEWDTVKGLHIQKVTVPLGVIAMIYESRPNVTVDAASLCLKSGNACVLRGGSESINSNKALARILRESIELAGVNPDAVNLIENTDRALVQELLAQRQYIDVAIPRGGSGLIHTVLETSKVPVIETGSGVCHVYVDKSADLDMAVSIIENAKVSRPSTCNAMETLLIHQDIADALLAKLLPVMDSHLVEMRGDKLICDKKLGILPATEEDWATEYNALIMSMKIVTSLKEAVDHISRYGTHHSETIVTENPVAAEDFLNEVDSAAVYVNASTRFTDGFEFGFGAEIGISTQKLHVRGPMGLEALVSFKYKIHGQGQVR